MRTNLSLFLCALLFLLFTSCQTGEAPAAIDMDALKAEIQAMEDAYAAAENAKDADAISDYYAEDAQSMPHGEPTVVGKASIIERMKSGFEKEGDKGETIRFEVVDVFAAGDLVVEVGRSVTTLPSGEQETGIYMSLFEKRDGKYVCIRDMWNSDADDDDGEDNAGEDDSMEEEEDTGS